MSRVFIPFTDTMKSPSSRASDLKYRISINIGVSTYFPCWQRTNVMHVIQIQHDLEDEKFIEIWPLSMSLTLNLTVIDLNLYLKVEKKIGNNKTHNKA